MADNKSNTGYYNTGHYNTGDCNTGYYNTGDYNTGHYNTGDCNTGNRNTGAFNTNEPNARLFNKDTGKKWSEIDIPHINLPVTEWVPEEHMSDKEKKANTNFYTTKGYLKKRTYKEAWSVAWAKLDEKTRKRFFALPNFDAAIFKEITGVDVTTPAMPSCAGRVVEIEGKKYRLQEV